MFVCAALLKGSRVGITRKRKAKKVCLLEAAKIAITEVERSQDHGDTGLNAADESRKFVLCDIFLSKEGWAHEKQPKVTFMKRLLNF